MPFLTDTGRYPTYEDVNYNGKCSLTFGEQAMTLGFGNRLKTIMVTEDGDSGYCLKLERTEGVTDTTKN